MDFIQKILGISIVIIAFITITRIYMIVTAYIGEKLGFGKFFIGLWKKMRR